MKKLLLIFFFFTVALQAQDKLYFKNGTSKNGRVVSVAEDVVYFKPSDTSATIQIQRSDLVLLEKQNGSRYLFGDKDNRKISNDEETFKYRNILSLQPISALWGRATIVYERISKDGKIGVAIPLTLTYDPFETLFSNVVDTSSNAPSKVSGVSFIGGLDLNFYLGKKPSPRFFIGPRIRYGTDMFLGHIEGYSVQTQLGWRAGGVNGRFVQHFSVGFGFVRLVSVPGAYYVDRKQSASWLSVNYRLGIGW